jgi:hypothetical protein
MVDNAKIGKKKKVIESLKKEKKFVNVTQIMVNEFTKW